MLVQIQCCIESVDHFGYCCHVKMAEGNSNPLQCSCLENPRDGEAWEAAVHGVSRSRTRLKRLSSLAAAAILTILSSVQ